MRILKTCLTALLALLCTAGFSSFNHLSCCFAHEICNPVGRHNPCDLINPLRFIKGNHIGERPIPVVFFPNQVLRICKSCNLC